MLPAIVGHADWSTAPTRRWMATARLQDGVYRVEPPDRVRSPQRVLESCVRERLAPEGAPGDREARCVEGWILGRC